MTRRLQHVFFDATDTLVRVRGCVGDIYARLAALHGLEAPSDEIEQSFQAALPAVPQDVAPGLAEDQIRTRERDWWRQVAWRAMERFGPFPGFEGFFDEVFETFRKRDAWEFVPEAPETLETLLAQGRRLGIISGMDSRLYDVLAAFGIDHYFDVVCLSFRTGYSKPDTRLFEDALLRAGATAGRSVHVGDSLTGDVQGALDAGLTALYLDPEGHPGAPPAAHAIRKLSEIPPLLERLDERDEAAHYL
ncbi:MAG: HAD-IA family hydrolase [Candidatus Krumholzibacteriia bacterium]